MVMPKYDSIEVAGYHGCYHTIAAIHAAKVLLEKNVVKKVIVRRAGCQHVPTFGDESKSAFRDYTDGMPHTLEWDGLSPRVVFDGDPETAMGASALIKEFNQYIEGPEDFNVPPMREELWEMVLKEKLLPLLAVAALSKAQGFFSVHPPGDPLRGVYMRLGGRPGEPSPMLYYDDLDKAPTVYGWHSLDPSTDPELARMLDRVSADFELGLALD